MPKVNRRRPLPATHAPDQRPELFEPLESRLALYTSPLLAGLPDPAAMASPDNTVVRFYTSVGVIDIELYDQQGPGSASAAPITTENFLNYVNLGRYDGTFFHRLVNTPTPFVLQGGGFAFRPPSTSQAVLTDPPIQNEFDPGRSNIERTIAMAKLGSSPDSATSQFFFNLDDNSGNLNNQNGGFTVFGKVIGGWDVVQEIVGFETRDLDQFFTGTTGSLYNDVPVSGNSNSDVVTILDAEVLKPADVTSFFSTSLFYPEGYRAASIVSNVELLNEDVNGEVAYQIIARFETGSRDKVIASGTLSAGAHLRVPVSEGGNPAINTVRPDTPFAYEIRATGPLAATLHHFDFGNYASEPFIDPEQFTEAQLKDWTFAGGLVGPGIPAFLLWENVAAESATVTATFYSETGQEFSITKALDPLRRGGLNLNELTGLPAGLFSVRVSSTQPIVAALSQYRAAPGRASTELGMIEGGAPEGVLPGAVIPSDGQSLISLLYTGESTADIEVSISFILTDGTVLDGGIQTLNASSRRRDLDLQVLNGALPTDEFFTIRYTVGVAPDGALPEKVSASYTSIAGGDTVRTPFQGVSTESLYFAGGSLDPAIAGAREVISLFNPFSDPGIMVNYRLRFHFVDAQIVTDLATIGPNGRVDIDVASLPSILAKINSGPQFRRYSISVETDITRGGGEIDAMLFGQLTRITPGGDSVTFGPTYSHTEPLLPAGFTPP